MRLLRRNAVTVRVEVPEGAEIEVATASADVEINGPVGDVDFKTASGNASIDDVAADVTTKTASGNVTIGTVGGDIRASTVSGDLRCSSVAGGARFSATSGDLELGAAGRRVEVKATSGHVRLGELAAGADVKNVSGNVRVLALGEGRLHVRSVSGDVAVGVVKGVELHVDVETASGLVHSDIPLRDGPVDGADRPGPGWTSASAASRATSRSGVPWSTWPDDDLPGGDRDVSARFRQSRSSWHTASSMNPNGSSHKVAK